MTEKRYGDYRDNFTEEDIQRAGAYLDGIISIEKSEKVNESQIDFLKSCPFCGSTDVRVLHHGTHSEHSVVCDNCHVWVDHLFDAMSKEEAIELWNRRVNE